MAAAPRQDGRGLPPEPRVGSPFIYVTPRSPAAAGPVDRLNAQEVDKKTLRARAARPMFIRTARVRPPRPRGASACANATPSPPSPRLSTGRLPAPIALTIGS